MADLFANLGINGKILVAQIINFAVLLLILTKFLYRPIVGMLNKRHADIEKSVAKSAEIEQRLFDVESMKETALAEARKASTELFKKAEIDAAAITERMLVEAKMDIARLTKEESKKLAQERERIMQEAKQNIGETVLAVIEKSLGDILDKKAQNTLAEQAIKSFSTKS